MANINNYGLHRKPSADVRRKIRQRCGFGCVICGLAYYDYEHFDPDFKDAKAHDPAGMTLLCPRCNQRRARGTLSAATVARANSNPKCKQVGFAFESFDLGHEPFTVIFAGVGFTKCITLVQVCGTSILSFKPPEEAEGPVLLSGIFADSTGATTLRIVDNEWFAGDESWDVEVVGAKHTIRRGPRDIALEFRVVPPHTLIVERINMRFKGHHLIGDMNALRTSEDGITWSSIGGLILHEADVAISIG